MELEEKMATDPTKLLPTSLHNIFTQSSAGLEDSPSKKSKVQTSSNAVRDDDLEELDDDDEDDDDIEEIGQEEEILVDEADDSTPVANQFQPWSGDWGEVTAERKNTRKRPAVDELPEDVREELASMGGLEVESRIRQRPKLESSDAIKDVNRGRKSPVDEISDFTQILSRPAKTPEERLAVLEARDKFIRSRSSQQPNTQNKNVGKCPDMCPEKERYQRIARHQVDYYEYHRDTKEVNHAFMVKIYARSSADQQMPLPHDLRPVNVLWMTMSYLVNQFMDLADNPGENLGEWYHFLWDRMRSIRKDVTQLALCDQLSVQILEICARFHIFCMERLREEKMAVFDEKINRENLTKCLQSLQYMYNDLSLKKISCPNEPEFQAYCILLHINSDLCTSTILGLRPEMRKHPQVQFAINAFVAVTMKNYVRFFKLVKATSYLNACILHQYFAQVRAHAMHSIIRAYSRQKMRNTYPLSELQEQLLFDSRTDVLEFCKFSKVPVEENNVVLEKNVSHPIPMQEKMKRSFAGVEGKRQSSIKDIVTGGCQLTDSAAYHYVHNSFDEEGVLKPEAWLAEDQDGGDISSNPLKTSPTPNNLSARFSIIASSSPSYTPKTFSSNDTPIFSGPKVISSQKFGPTAVPRIRPGNLELPERPVKVPISAFSFTTESATKPKASDDHSHMSVSSVHKTGSYGIEKSDTSIKPFVFNLVETTTESKESNQSYHVSSFLQPPFSTSIFGGSVNSGTPRSPGASVMRSGKGLPSIKQVHETAAAFWNSQQLPLDPGNQLKDTKIVDTNQTVPRRSTFSFGTSTTSSGGFSGTFNIGGNNFWSSPTVVTSNQGSHFTSTGAPVDNFALAMRSSFNQFPSSVYGFQTTSPEDNISSVTTLGHNVTQKSMPVIADFISNTDDSTNRIPVSATRDVTVPTSIFGFHSRPLTTPQMFSSSSTSCSVVVSPQTVSTATSSLKPQPMSPQVNTSATGGFVFSLAHTQSASPLSSANRRSFSAEEDSDLIKTNISHESTSQHSEDEESSYSSDSETTEEEEELSDEEEEEEKENSEEDTENSAHFTFKAESQKFKSPLTRNSSKKLVSPVCEEVVTSPKMLDASQDKARAIRVQQLVSKVAYMWRLRAYRSKVRQRVEAQEECIPLVNQLSLEEQVENFPIPMGCVAVDIQTRLDCLLSLEDMKTVNHLLPSIGDIKLEEIVSDVLPSALSKANRFESNMFWKLFISLPGEEEGKKYSLQLSCWLEDTFTNKLAIKSRGILRLSRTKLGGQYNIFTCVQMEVGSLKSNLGGVNGLIFFTPRNMKNRNIVCERYQQIIKSLSPNTSIPLVIVVSNPAWEEICRKWCEDDVLHDKLSHFKIIGPLHYDKSLVAQEMDNIIRWLVKCVKSLNMLEKWTMREVLVSLMIDLWSRVRYTLSSRCSSGHHQHPEDLINLYHDALEKLSSMVANNSLNSYGDIPSELECLANASLGERYESRMIIKSTQYIQEIKNGFSSVKFNVKVPPEESLSVESFCEAVCVYNERLRGPVSHFLCRRESNDNIDWSEIVEALIAIHIRDVIGILKLQKLVVIFEKSTFVDFCTKPWYTKWLKDRLKNRDITTDVSFVDETPSSDVVNPKNDCDTQKIVDNEEMLISDFESMLNTIDKEFDIKGLDPKQAAKVSEHFDVCDNSSVSALDIFELQLDKYTKL